MRWGKHTSETGTDDSPPSGGTPPAEHEIPPQFPTVEPTTVQPTTDGKQDAAQGIKRKLASLSGPSKSSKARPKKSKGGPVEVVAVEDESGAGSDSPKASDKWWNDTDDLKF